jgi:hypothetical protein
VSYLPQSDGYWAFWIAVAFLIPELLAVFHVIPLDTFSKTTQLNEKLHPFLKPIVFGFGVGLVVHLVYGTNFFKAMAGGAFAAVAAAILGGL